MVGCFVGWVRCRNELPIYDFHFNKITEDVSILEDRGLYADPMAETH